MTKGSEVRTRCYNVTFPRSKDMLRQRNVPEARAHCFDEKEPEVIARSISEKVPEGMARLVYTKSI